MGLRSERRMSRLPMKSISMRAKLILSFICLIMVFMGVGVYNLLNVRRIEAQIARQSEEASKELAALKLKQMVEDLSVFMSGFMLSKNPDMKEDYRKKADNLVAQIGIVGASASTSEERKWKAQLDMTIQEYARVFEQAEEVIHDKSLSPAGVNARMEQLFNSSQIHKEFVYETIDKFIQKFAEDSKAASVSSQNMLDSTANVSVVAPIIVLLFAAVVAFLLIRSFMAPIERLRHAVVQLASGDLRHKINSDSQDELGELSRNFDKMVDQVRNMLQHTRTVAASFSEHAQSFRRFSQETAAANANILKAIEEISSGADQQARQSEQSSHVISDLEREIQAILSYAQQMKETSRLAESNTQFGTQAVYALNGAAEQTAHVYDKIAAAMHSLSSSSTQIGNIVNTIAEISTQTNVLSLNAAIEAAKAGAHGKGFSVIAEEVRRLSQQTNESSKSIARIIRSLQKQIKDLERQMSDARSAIGTQNGKVAETLAAFASIQQSIGEVIGQIEHVNGKVDQARSRSQQLVESVQFVAAVAEETAAGVQEVNSTSIQQDSSIRHIAEQANDIHRLSLQLFAEISRFKIDDGAGAVEAQTLRPSEDERQAGEQPADVAVIRENAAALSDMMESSEADQAETQAASESKEAAACAKQPEKELVKV